MTDQLKRVAESVWEINAKRAAAIAVVALLTFGAPRVWGHYADLIAQVHAADREIERQRIRIDVQERRLHSLEGARRADDQETVKLRLEIVERLTKIEGAVEEMRRRFAGPGDRAEPRAGGPR